MEKEYKHKIQLEVQRSEDLLAATLEEKEVFEHWVRDFEESHAQEIQDKQHYY